MDFREKLESALTPLIAQLKGRLASLPTRAVLNHYQLQIDTVKTDKSNVPDGFLFKWRYLWALQLSNPFSDADVNHDSESQFKSIDELTEQIFDVYGFGAMLEPGGPEAPKRSFSLDSDSPSRSGSLIFSAFQSKSRVGQQLDSSPSTTPTFCPLSGCASTKSWIGYAI
jgi:hypothetical protein